MCQATDGPLGFGVHEVNFTLPVEITDYNDNYPVISPVGCLLAQEQVVVLTEVRLEQVAVLTGVRLAIIGWWYAWCAGG